MAEGNFGIRMNIPMDFTIPMPGILPDLDFDYTLSFDFNTATILLILGGMSAVYLLSSINVVDSGVTDSGTLTLKQFISFISKYFILNLPIMYFMNSSVILQEYIILISLLILLIYFLSFLIDIGDEKNSV